MNKIVIVINGKGGVGKDTLCNFTSEVYKVLNVSSITPIKNIASQYGWNGEKDSRSRKFLSDLKKTFVDYMDLPCEYCVKRYERFIDSDNQIMFVHIREGEEIDKFKKRITDIPCVTLLIRRNNGNNAWGNSSDDEVESYSYDYYYNNNKPLSEAKNDFLEFLRREVLI